MQLLFNMLSIYLVNMSDCSRLYLAAHTYAVHKRLETVIKPLLIYFGNIACTNLCVCTVCVCPRVSFVLSGGYGH